MNINSHHFILGICLLFLNSLYCQVGIGTNSPDSSAALEVTSPSNNKGVLLPRLTQIQRTGISSPASGLLVYQTNGTSGLYYYDGSDWLRFGEVQTVNGVSPTIANGNVAVTFLSTQTGTQSNRTSTVSPADGLVHIVTGNTPSSEDGKVYIYSSATSSWNETSAFTDDQDISGSSFDFTSGDLVIGITGGVSETISLASLTVTPTLDEVTDVGSTTTNGIDVGSLTVNSSYTLPSATAVAGSYLTVSTTTSELVFTLQASSVTPTLDEVTDVGSTTTNGIDVGSLTVNSSYTLPSSTAVAGSYLTVSTTTSELIFTLPASSVTPTLDEVTDVGSTTTNGIDVGSLTVNSSYTLPTSTSAPGFYLTVSSTNSELVFSVPPVPDGTSDGDIIHWNPAGNWERTDEFKVPFSSGSIVSNRTIEPKTDLNFDLGSSTKRFTNIYGSTINSGAASITINTTATGTPTISLQQNGTEKAGIGSNTFFVGDSNAGSHYFFPETIATSSKQALVTGQNSNTLVFLDFANLEAQSLDDVLSNGEESNRNIFVASLTVSQTANFATGPDDEDIYIGEFGVDNDDVFISARLNTDLKLESDSTYDLGELDKNFARIFSNQIISNSRLSITASNTTDDDIEFIHNGTIKAGINSITFYIGDRGASTYYEFPRERPVSVSNQVLTYSAASSLTWSSLLNLPAGNQEGMSLRWNNSTSNWETASSTLIFSGGVSATTVTATNISIGSQITFSSNATTVPPLNLVANNLNDGVGALRMEGSEPDIFLNQNSAGFNTVTFATANNQVNAFGKNSSDDFYITVKDGGLWKDNTFVINNSSGDLSLGYKLSVTGSSTLSELKVGSSGNDYTLPISRGTAGEVLTVSTTTNLLSFESTSFGKHYMLAELTVADNDLKVGDEIQNLVATTSNGVTLSPGGKIFTLTQGKVYKLTGYVEVSGDQVASTFSWRVNGVDIGKQGVSTSTSTNRQDKFILPSVAFYRATSSATVVLRCVTVTANSGNVSTVNSGSYVIIEEL